MYVLLLCVQLFLLFSLFLATYDLKTTLSQSSWILRWKQTNKKETKEKRKKDRNNGEKVSMLYRLSFWIDVIPSVFVCLSVQLPTFEVLLSILFLLRFELFCFFFCPKNLRIYGQQAVKTWKECLSPESCCQCPAILSTNALTRSPIRFSNFLGFITMHKSVKHFKSLSFCYRWPKLGRGAWEMFKNILSKSLSLEPLHC